MALMGSKAEFENSLVKQKTLWQTIFCTLKPRERSSPLKQQVR